MVEHLSVLLLCLLSTGVARGPQKSIQYSKYIVDYVKEGRTSFTIPGCPEIINVLNMAARASLYILPVIISILGICAGSICYDVSQCTTGYMCCYGTKWCCPFGSSCTGTSLCNTGIFNNFDLDGSTQDEKHDHKINMTAVIVIVAVVLVVKFLIIFGAVKACQKRRQNRQMEFQRFDQPPAPRPRNPQKPQATAQAVTTTREVIAVPCYA